MENNETESVHNKTHQHLDGVGSLAELVAKGFHLLVAVGIHSFHLHNFLHYFLQLVVLIAHESVQRKTIQNSYVAKKTNFCARRQRDERRAGSSSGNHVLYK